MKTSKNNHCHTGAQLKVVFLMKTILLLCLTQHCVSFGLAGSEIRSNRAPITCFPAESRKPSSSLSSSLSNNSSSSSVEKDTTADGKIENNIQLEQNTKYVKGLIDTLDGLLEKWAVTGNMGTVRSYMLY